MPKARYLQDVINDRLSNASVAITLHSRLTESASQVSH